ncbi:probable jasmonic acid carboxyl methyltransferase 2 [Aristolochia californica]|uniref:probable jasmonic acid carboxyl methyltransferase 2 n=1 Tax=Aristolochia californica TaxID=171875 RepID=UPI0035DD8D25
MVQSLTKEDFTSATSRLLGFKFRRCFIIEEEEEAKRSTEAMKVPQVMSMKGGVGQNSYTNNSSIQNIGISQLKHLIREAILDLYSTTFLNNLVIADLGCSSGPNTFMVLSEIIEAIDERKNECNLPLPEIFVYLNDLPGNDFNTIFHTHMARFYENLMEGKKKKLPNCFIAGTPGSFYARLFPMRTLHFVHSSYSVHWLSQVPPGLEDETGQLNKGKIYISAISPPCVFETYLKQFQKDFSQFLRFRSEEMVTGGRMILSFAGRKSGRKEYCYSFIILTQALKDMVSQGFVEEAKLDSFNIPYFSPCVEELKDVIDRENSFDLDRIERFDVVLDACVEDREKPCSEADKYKIGSIMEKGTRAMTEEMLASHFGMEILDKLFQRFREIASERWHDEQDNLLNIGVSLTRKHL